MNEEKKSLREENTSEVENVFCSTDSKLIPYFTNDKIEKLISFHKMFIHKFQKKENSLDVSLLT